jgi:hypothetical protein
MSDSQQNSQNHREFPYGSETINPDVWYIVCDLVALFL